jgi:hypothetical protein
MNKVHGKTIFIQNNLSKTDFPFKSDDKKLGFWWRMSSFSLN